MTYFEYFSEEKLCRLILQGGIDKARYWERPGAQDRSPWRGEHGDEIWLMRRSQIWGLSMFHVKRTVMWCSRPCQMSYWRCECRFVWIDHHSLTKYLKSTHYVPITNCWRCLDDVRLGHFFWREQEYCLTVLMSLVPAASLGFLGCAAPFLLKAGRSAQRASPQDLACDSLVIDKPPRFWHSV